MLWGGGVVALLGMCAIVWFFFIAGRPPANAIMVPRDFPTIQSALEHASPGATIVVKAGSGPFKGPLVIQTPTISILAAGGRAVIQCDNMETGITIDANDVTLRGFKVRTSGVAVRVERSSGSLLDDVVTEEARIGIQLVDSDSNTFSHISVRNGDTGIEMTSANRNTLQAVSVDTMSDVGLRLSSAWANVICQVTVNGAPVGISVEQDSEENRISSCVCNNCATSGAEILSSSANVLSTSTFTDCGTAVMMNAADNNTVHENRIQNSLKCGVSIYKSQQNTVSLNAITSGLQDGISLVDAQENAVSYNSIDSCAGTSIKLESAKSNLLLGNKLTRSAIGIQGLSVEENRILRNELRENALVGIAMSEGGGNILLDNVVQKSAYGIALIGTTGNELLRNCITDSSAEGLSLLNRADHNLLQDFTIENDDIGILIAASSQSTLLNSSVTGSDVAVRLFRSGVGTRIEGNSITGNSIGLEIAARLDKDETILRGSDVPLSAGEEGFHVVLVHNTFARNTAYDISNLTDDTVYAGGNYWDGRSREAQGHVSDGVVLPRSAWKGTIALGTTDSLGQIIIARMMQLALSEDGFKAVDLIGLGNDEKVMEALAAGDIDLALADPSFSRVGDMSGSEVTVSPALEVEDGLSLIVSSDVARRLPANNISDLAAYLVAGDTTLTIAVQKTVSQAQVQSFASTYGIALTDADVIRTNDIDETETLLKLGKADACLVSRIEETLTLMGFTALEDGLGAFSVSHTAFIAPQGIIVAYPEIGALEQQLRSLVTTDVVHSLVSKVRLLHSDPAEVAREFMAQHGLIEQ